LENVHGVGTEQLKSGGDAGKRQAKESPHRHVAVGIDQALEIVGIGIGQRPHRALPVTKVGTIQITHVTKRTTLSLYDNIVHEQ
jgi:hypothetical protein